MEEEAQKASYAAGGFSKELAQAVLQGRGGRYCRLDRGNPPGATEVLRLVVYNEARFRCGLNRLRELWQRQNRGSHRGNGGINWKGADDGTSGSDGVNEGERLLFVVDVCATRKTAVTLHTTGRQRAKFSGRGPVKSAH